MARFEAITTRTISFKTYLKYVKEIFSDNKEIISQQYVGVSLSFYNESINKWISIFSTRKEYQDFKNGYLVFKLNGVVRVGSKKYNENKEDMGTYYTPLNDKQFLSLMIGKECVWYDDMISSLIDKYE
tara:strand:- start:184 stop:567 length:384 start_codon:yes stop_codon:yes gene_type:complete